MLSFRSVFSAIAALAMLSSVSAEVKVVISPNPIDDPTQIFEKLFENAPGIAISNAKLSAGCKLGSTGTVNSFTTGSTYYDIDHGIVIQAACSISADVVLPVQNTLTVNYFFYTYKATNVNLLTGNDAFSLTVDNLDANSNVTPAPVTYSVQNLQNSNTNIGTRASTTGVTILPKGKDRITVVLTNNSPFFQFSGVAIGPFQLTSSVSGDPQFNGFLGQSFQVHGSANTVYNVISTPNFQYNARFDFLAQGECRQGTECFAHPGNYFGQVGVMIQDGPQVDKIEITSGSVTEGLTAKINDVAMRVGESKQIGAYKVALMSKFEVALESSEFSIVLQNSDMFLNQMVAIGSSLQSSIRQFKLATNTKATSTNTLLASLPHGILGQTWQSKTYDNRWKHIEGQLFDYIQSEGIFGTNNKFNRFA